MQQRYGLQGCLRATLTRTTPSHAEADERDTLLSKPVGPSGRVILPWLDQVKGNPFENTSSGYTRGGSDALYTR